MISYRNYFIILTKTFKKDFCLKKSKNNNQCQKQRRGKSKVLKSDFLILISEQSCI